MSDLLGKTFYVPFWILLEFLDISPPDPFIKVEVLDINTKHGSGPDGPMDIICCDLACCEKKQLIAHNIPVEYLIAPADLKRWTKEISDWFLTFHI